MKKINLSIVLFVHIFTNNVIAEETAYVTDSLQLRLYTEASDKSEVIQTMQSGESVEVIETKGAFSHVRTYDNSAGWVKSAFLVTETPPTLLYYSVSEENKKLKQELELLQNNVNVSSEEMDTLVDTSKINDLKQELLKQQEANQELQKQLATMQENNSSLPTSYVKKKVTSFNEFAYQTGFLTFEKLLILLAALLTFLLFGIILGARFSSRRMRKRLHGFTLD